MFHPTFKGARDFTQENSPITKMLACVYFKWLYVVGSLFIYHLSLTICHVYLKEAHYCLK